jgi:hypothetical protein
MIRVLAVFMAAACGSTAQIDSGLDLWVRVREHVRVTAAGLPNYTCQETMERSIHGPSGQIELRERLRLEVLFAETTERFAWPGSSEFSSEPLKSWIRAGAIGNGTFATQLLSLFVKSAATVRYAGIETHDQRALHRFDFHMPLLSSGYTLALHGKSATTAYSGTFWVDQQSLDIIRMETHAEEIPDLDCSEVRESVTYGRVGGSAGERLLPSTAELVIVNRDGHESRNAIAFSNCRHYTAASSLSFSPSPDFSTTAKPQPQRTIPSDVVLALRLEQPISAGESMAGDQIVARLDKPVTAGSALLPKGTRVLGRIRRLEQQLGSPPSILVGLQFFAAEVPGGLITFSARLTGPRATQEVTQRVFNTLETVPGAAGLDIEEDGTRTGVGSFRVLGKNSVSTAVFALFGKRGEQRELSVLPLRVGKGPTLVSTAASNHAPLGSNPLARLR